MFLRRILQSLYRCFPIFHINLKARSYPIEFLSCNPPNPLLARQIVRHIVVEPIRICNNNINQPLQIAEKSGKGILIPSVIRFSFGTRGAIRYDEMRMFSVCNANRPELFVSIRGDMKPLRFRWIECAPVRKERIFALILSRSNQFLDITPFLRSGAWHLNVEATLLIISHYGKSLELMLNFN